MALNFGEYLQINYKLEKDFEPHAVRLLQLNGFIVVRINTIKSGNRRSYRIFNIEQMIIDKAGTIIEMAEPNTNNEGFTDLIAFYPPDRCLLIETKAGKNKLRASQERFKAFLGSIGMTNVKKASTVEELQEIIKEFKHGKC